MPPLSIPAHLASLLDLFSARGEAAYPVGGCVRDALLGTPPHDWDVAVTTPPEMTQDLCESAGLRVVPTGIKHGTVTVLLPHSGDFADRTGTYDPIECTTCRTEGGYSDGRHPDTVTFTGRIADDLSRRDFTVNAMAIARDETGRSTVLDLFGGQTDLAAGLIRCVGDPATRFSEDALRMLRAVRFAVKLGFDMDPATESAIRSLAPTLSRISRERITEEFVNILCSPAPERGIALLQKNGLLPHVLPAGILHDMTGNLSELPPDLSLRLSTLLWGLPHDRINRNLAALRLPSATANAVKRLSRPQSPILHPRAVDARRLRRTFGEEAEAVLLVRRARIQPGDIAATDEYHSLTELIKLVRASAAAQDPVTLRELAVNGRDLIDAGYKRGPTLQPILARLLDAVVEDPSQNSRDILLTLAGQPD